MSNAAEQITGPQWDSQRQVNISQKFQAYLKAADACYGKVIGKKVGTVYTPLVAKVTAETDGGETATLEHCYLIEAPVRALRDQLEQIENRP